MPFKDPLIVYLKFSRGLLHMFFLCRTYEELVCKIIMASIVKKILKNISDISLRIDVLRVMYQMPC